MATQVLDWNEKIARVMVQKWNQRDTQKIFKNALAEMAYEPFSAYLLAHARMRALRTHGIKARVVRGVPRSWR